MSLNYNILWLDDNIAEYNDLGCIGRVEKHIKDCFFNPIIIQCEDFKEADDAIAKNKFDLILSDYNISEDQNGDDFLKDIRNNKTINSEVLFYSAQPEYDSIAQELMLDRISYINIKSTKADGYDRLVAKINALFDLTVEKFQELSAIRGMVMTETSVLDKIMSDIIKFYFIDNSSPDTETLFNKIKKEMEKSVKGTLVPDGECGKKCTLKISTQTIQEIIKSRAFETSKKAYAINKIIEKEKLNIKFRKSFYEDYLEDIINRRNKLAHSYSIIKEGKEVLVVEEADDMIYFDREKCDAIRMDIIKYQGIFDGIKKGISFSD